MKLTLETAFSLSLCDLADTLHKYNNPIIIIDKGLKIIGKNKKAAIIFPRLRRGGKIERFLPHWEVEKLSSLGNRQTCYIQMQSGERICGATAVCGADRILLLIRPMWTGLRERLEKIYNKASGYDMSIPAEYTEAEELMATLLEKHCSVRGVKFFNVGSMTSAVLLGLEAVSKSVFARVRVTRSVNDAWAFGSEYDFSAVLIYGIFVCADYAKGDIHLSISQENGLLVINVRGNSDKEDEEVDEFVDKFACGGLHWMSPIKLIADGNLWDLDLEITGGEDISINFTIPVAEASEPFTVSDSHKGYILSILRRYFS